MNSSQIIRTVFEIALVVITVWSVFHEDIFIALEERIASFIRRRRLKVVSNSSVNVLK